MLYLQIASPKSSVLNFLDSNSFEVIISIFQRTEKVPDMERLPILVDGGDLVPITEGMYTLREMLDNKIKAAQTMGRIYVDSTNLADKVIRQ